jgi:hypothetical protein
VKRRTMPRRELQTSYQEQCYAKCYIKLEYAVKAAPHDQTITD